MDETATYTKMAGGSAEIQALNKAEIGNYYWQPKIGEFCILTYPHEKVQYAWEKPHHEAILVSLKDYALHEYDHHAIWLPRQDQLQAMIEEELEVKTLDSLHHYFQIFIEWFNARNGDWRIREVDTYEKLWLAFVMHEKYHKVWNGEEWIPE